MSTSPGNATSAVCGLLDTMGATELLELRRRIIEGSPVDARGCWVWRASTHCGYGQISIHDTNFTTHRLSYILFVGQIPRGMHVCHRCDVRRCNNPEHFFLGTQADNIRDMWAKGRGKKPPIRRGETHPNARLTDEQVAEIRALRAGGVHQRVVAKQFGCSQSTVWRLTHGVVRS